jgi:predicted  nucleic acid-binding Zn-ribbon protein
MFNYNNNDIVCEKCGTQFSTFKDLCCPKCEKEQFKSIISQPKSSLYNNEERLKEVSEKLEKSKKTLKESASEYINKYKDEVNDGDERYKLFLTEGASGKLSEEDIIKHESNFYPTSRTPILNMLHYLNKEFPDANNLEMRRLDGDTSIDPITLLNKQNREYGSLQHDRKDEQTADVAPSMETYLYGNMTHDIYKKVKKLKALSQSPVQAEAEAALKKCLELCKEFGLEFDRVKI